MATTIELIETEPCQVWSVWSTLLDREVPLGIYNIAGVIWYCGDPEVTSWGERHEIIVAVNGRHHFNYECRPQRHTPLQFYIGASAKSWDDPKETSFTNRIRVQLSARGRTLHRASVGHQIAPESSAAEPHPRIRVTLQPVSLAMSPGILTLSAPIQTPAPIPTPAPTSNFDSDIDSDIDSDGPDSGDFDSDASDDFDSDLVTFAQSLLADATNILTNRTPALKLPAISSEPSASAAPVPDETRMGVCRVCFLNPLGMIYPCGHLCVCVECGGQAPCNLRCPICNSKAVPFRIYVPS